MNVLRITPHFYFPPSIIESWEVHRDPIGGMQTQIYRTSLCLSQKGIRQKILTIGMKGAPRSWFLDDNVEVCASNAPIIPIKSRVRGTVGLNFYWGIGVLASVALKAIKAKFTGIKNWDVIHSHCSGVISPLLVGLWCKSIIGLPLVYTVHCCRICTYEPINFLDHAINKYVIKLEKKCLSSADSVFVLTQKTKEAILQQYTEVKPDRVSVIPDIISFNDFPLNITPEKIANFYSEFNIPIDRPIISFIGRIAHEKGWKYFLKAIALTVAENYHVIFAGDGNERKELQNMIKRLGLSERVTITGFIPNDLVANVISISEFLVIPSVHEELGSLLLEAASLHKTVIASAVGGLKTIINNQVSGLLVEPKSATIIAEKIDYLLANKEVAEKMGNQLYEDLRKIYEAAPIIDKIIESYQSVAQN